jgi:site-specific DNA-adenine methylase
MRNRRLIRWMGSKQHLVEALGPLLRRQAGRGGRCISLFYGSGALEQAAFPGERVIAAEANPDLVALHRQAAADPLRLWRALAFLEDSSRRRKDGEGAYRAVSRWFPSSPLQRAARCLWLISISRSGMWRVSSSGRFNVPPDRDRLARAWPFPRMAVLQEAAACVRGTTFVPDWREALAAAREGDLVLADPPYAGGFVEYTARRFRTEDQRELAAALRAAGERGIAVIAFNSLLAALWYPAPWSRFIAPRSGRLNSRADLRDNVDELVATLGVEALPLLPYLPEERTAPCALAASA